MATIPTGLGNITFSNIVIALIVVLLAIDVYIRVMTAIKAYREEKQRKNQPVSTLEDKVQEHEEKLQKDYKRINELEDGNRITLRALMALLSHDINNNSVDKLKASMDEIHDYLVNR